MGEGGWVRLLKCSLSSCESSAPGPEALKPKQVCQFRVGKFRKPDPASISSFSRHDRWLTGLGTMPNRSGIVWTPARIRGMGVSENGKFVKTWVKYWIWSYEVEDTELTRSFVKIFCRKLDGLSFSKKIFVKKLFRSRVTPEKRDSGGEISSYLNIRYARAEARAHRTFIIRIYIHTVKCYCVVYRLF